MPSPGAATDVDALVGAAVVTRSSDVAPVTSPAGSSPSGEAGTADARPDEGGASPSNAASAPPVVVPPATAPASARAREGAAALAAPALALDDGRRGSAPIFLLIGLMAAIGLLAIATVPPTAARRGGIAAAALAFRFEIAIAGALLLLASAVAFFLTA
jgi:hypothetical protein